MAHTKDIGAAIQSALEILDTVEFRADWDNPDNAEVADECGGDDLFVDASHGHDDLRITIPDGSRFRVVITRI